jgi:hypothetical protein
MYYLSSSLVYFVHSECFLARMLFQKTRGHMLTPEFGRFGRAGQTARTRSNRPDQILQKAIWTLPLDRTRRVDQDSYIECPNRSPDEGDTASGRSARRARG